MNIFSYMIVIIATSFLTMNCSATLDETLNKMVEAYGGPENLKKMNSYRTTWKVLGHGRKQLEGKEREGQMIRSISFPDKMKMELIYFSTEDGRSEYHETRVINKNKGIKTVNENANQLQGIMLEAIILQLRRHYTPLILWNQKSNLKMGQEIGGYYIIILTKDKITSIFKVNKETYHIEKVTGLIQMKGKVMPYFIVHYSDFKKVEGVLLPHKEEVIAGPTKTSTQYLKKVEFNQRFSDNLFDTK